jgi:hypothetical protein
MQRAFELRDNVPAYDATYVALAEILGCELLTVDQRDLEFSYRLSLADALDIAIWVASALRCGRISALRCSNRWQSASPSSDQTATPGRSCWSGPR